MAIEITYGDYTDDTSEKVISLVNSRFPPEAEAIARRILRNPLRKLHCSAGDVAFRDGQAVAFQATILRKLYYRQTPFLGTVAAMLCKSKKGCPYKAVLKVNALTGDSRYGGKLWFGNTACVAALEVGDEVGFLPGPESCSYYSYTPITWIAFLSYVFKRKLLKTSIPNWSDGLPSSVPFSIKRKQLQIHRVFNIDKKELDDFWACYIATNAGLVASRTGEELEWMFGDRISDGSCVMLVASDERGLVGYIVIAAESRAARRWQIVDMIALQNDERVIAALLSGAKKFLRKRTHAFLFETMGFPMFVQKVIRRKFPFKRNAANNFFAYRFMDEDLKRDCGSLTNMERSGSWFFGPYDGDMCM